MVAVEVEQLANCLREQREHPKPDFERHVLQRLQDVIEPAWWLNCVADLRWSGVEYVGQPLKGIQFAQEYFKLFVQQTTAKHHFELFMLYWAVNSLLFSPQVLLNPQMVKGILADASSEEKKSFTHFLAKSGRSLEEQLEQIPTFSQASFLPFPPQN